jgi:hypothetical protein
MKNLQVALDERLHQRLKRVAADRGETLGNLVRQAVTLLVETHERAINTKTGEGRQS